MPIYEVREDSLTLVSATSFETERLTERGDIQRLLKDRITCLEDGLMVLAEEFSDWQDSSRRIDLLCLDTEANLVVVELKRTNDGGHMELQAIRYAAMVSAMTFDQAVEACARYRARNVKGATDHDAARSEILAFLNWPEPVEDDFAKDTRIILASADFSKEMTTSVMWLRDRDIDIRCVRLKPYRLEDGRVLMDIQQLIPLPEAAEFQTRIGVKRQAERKEGIERHDLRLRFWQGLLDVSRQHTQTHAGRSPNKDTWIGGTMGLSGFTPRYFVRRHDSHVDLWIYFGPGQRDRNKQAYQALWAQKDDIEAEFGAPLIWEDDPDQDGAAVRYNLEGGYRDPAETWAETQERLAEAMARLERSMRQRAAAVKV